MLPYAATRSLVFNSGTWMVVTSVRANLLQAIGLAINFVIRMLVPHAQPPLLGACLWIKRMLSMIQLWHRIIATCGQEPVLRA